MRDPAFGFDKPEHSPGFLLWQTMVMWQRQIKSALDQYHISHAQFVILANVLWFEGIRQSPTQITIVKSTKLDKMTVSKSLKKLTEDGLIKRVEDENDSRAKAVSLTKKGKALASKLVPVVEQVDETFFGSINPHGQRSLIKILAGLVMINDKEV